MFACVCVFADARGTALSESRYKLSNVHSKVLSACINDWGAILVTWYFHVMFACPSALWCHVSSVICPIKASVFT